MSVMSNAEVRGSLLDEIRLLVTALRQAEATRDAAQAEATRQTLLTRDLQARKPGPFSAPFGPIAWEVCRAHAMLKFELAPGEMRLFELGERIRVCRAQAAEAKTADSRQLLVRLAALAITAVEVLDRG